MWNATLEYSTVYIASIVAINCAGESEEHLLQFRLTESDGECCFGISIIAVVAMYIP
jgi:hypothetical protein